MSSATGVPAIDAAEPLRPALARCIRGEIPPNVAVMQMLVASPDLNAVEAGLERTMELLDRTGDDAGVERLRQAANLLERHPEAPRLVREILAGLPRDDDRIRETDVVAFWAAAFDRAFDISPEASVALYSLGDRDLLDVSTAEVTRFLRASGHLGGEKHVLDFGCGFGRLLEALAGEAAHVIGIDVSERMVTAARARCADLDDVHIVQGTGRDLQALPDESIDTVVAVDSFPYIVAGGAALISEIFAELARVLKRGGALVIFNWSYRDDPAADEDDLRIAAEVSGLVARPRAHVRFLSWDAQVFVVSKPSADAG